jgi:hypothetical protein
MTKWALQGGFWLGLGVGNEQDYEIPAVTGSQDGKTQVMA